MNRSLNVELTRADVAPAVQTLFGVIEIAKQVDGTVVVRVERRAAPTAMERLSKAGFKVLPYETLYGYGLVVSRG